MNFHIGDTVGGYEIVGVLGSGGMGEVYRVRNIISDRVDAMKVLLANLQRDQDFAARFLREIKVQARLVHPNIAQLYTAFEHQGNLMMILELVDGMSLLEILQRGRLPVSAAVEYASQMLTALGYAHAQGVIHRDIKPGNVMVTPTGSVKLMDFGIAKAATDRSLTITGNLIGSLYYMSPEQVRGETIDNRSDLYSVGVVLYQMATGRKPFEGDSEYSIMRAQVEHAPPAPSSIDAAVPEELSRVILRALDKDPARRFQTGEEFREALEKVAMLLWEDEIGTTRMLGQPAAPTEAVPRPQMETPTAPREAARTAPQEAAPKIRTETPVTAPQAPAVLKKRAAEPVEQPSGSRTSLWIALGIAAAVLVVAGTQLFDWMASERADGPIAETQIAEDPPAPAPAGLAQQPQPATEPAPPVNASPATAPSDSEQSAASSRPSRAPAAAPKAAGSPSPQTARDGAAAGAATQDPPAEQTASVPRPITPPPAASAPVPAPVSQAPPTQAAAPKAPPSGEATNTQKSAAAPQPSSAPANPLRAAGSAAAGSSDQAPAGAATKSEPTPPAPPPSSNPVSTPAAASPPPQAPAAPADRVYEPDEVDTRPRLLRRVQPLYTEAAHQAGVQGRVRLSAEIWPDGRAHNIRILDSVGHPDLDRNAAAALSRWQFAPGRKDGVAVKVRAVIDQIFRLQGGRSAPALSKDR